jgi:hypothetical protein
MILENKIFIFFVSATQHDTLQKKKSTSLNKGQS